MDKKLLEKAMEASKAKTIKELFAEDSARAEKYTVSAAGWTLDYSKNRIDAATMKPLFKMAEVAGLKAEIEKAGGIDFTKPVLLGYSGISDALLCKYIEDSRHIWEGNLETVRYTTVGSVIGTHAGPGAVVVAFFKH